MIHYDAERRFRAGGGVIAWTAFIGNKPNMIVFSYVFTYKLEYYVFVIMRKFCQVEKCLADRKSKLFMPPNKEMEDIWRHIINKSSVKSVKVCSKHFLQSDVVSVRYYLLPSF